MVITLTDKMWVLLYKLVNKNLHCVAWPIHIQKTHKKLFSSVHYIHGHVASGRAYSEIGYKLAPP